MTTANHKKYTTSSRITKNLIAQRLITEGKSELGDANLNNRKLLNYQDITTISRYESQSLTWFENERI